MPLSQENMEEVFSAVSESAENGYDSEYMMTLLMDSPGQGVGTDKLSTKASTGTRREYANPLRNVLSEHFQRQATKSGNGISAEQYLDYIRNSSMQLYWPYSENWDGHSRPVITFDPLNGEEANTGYYMDDNGQIQELMVDEKMAMERPVWVINNNDDSRHVTLEVLKKNNPQWGEGGAVVVNPYHVPGPLGSKASSDEAVKCLLLKSIMLRHNYDSWFEGANELFFKLGSVESFRGMKESDLQLYNPSITDFVMVVRRSRVGKPIYANTLLVSEWTPQLQNCALMIIEDDGGTVTSWDCNAVVKINSKSYGFEIKIPYRSKDDIVWRGQLSRRYIEATDECSGNFGDCQLTFDIKQL